MHVVHVVTGKISNLFKSFSITMEPLIEDIRDKEEILKKYAWMATMERIKGLPKVVFIMTLLRSL